MLDYFAFHTYDWLLDIHNTRNIYRWCVPFFIVVCTEIQTIVCLPRIHSQPYTEANHTLSVMQILIYWKYCLAFVCVASFFSLSAVLSFLQHLIRYFVIVFIIGFYFIASVLFLLNFSVTSIRAIWMSSDLHCKFYKCHKSENSNKIK